MQEKKRYAFESVVGHEQIIARIKASLMAGRVGHAYVFTGAEGMGKKTLARAFARQLQCEGDGSGECTCLSCRVFDSGNHPDILFVSGTGTKSIGVEDVRAQILRPMNTKPYRYRYKIFMVEEAESLTTAAQNALLKIVEEPAAYGIFLLLATHIRAFLPTILSRCAVFSLKPLSDAQVRRALENAGIPKETARMSAALARGNIGRAQALADSEELRQIRQLALIVVEETPQTDLLGVFSLYKRLEPWKESIQLLLEQLYACYRDLLIYKATGALERMVQPDCAARLKAVAEGSSLKGLVLAAESVTRAGRALKQNANFQLTMETLLLDLQQTGSGNETAEEENKHDGCGSAV